MSIQNRWAALEVEKKAGESALLNLRCDCASMRNAVREELGSEHPDLVRVLSAMQMQQQKEEKRLRDHQEMVRRTMLEERA